MFLLLLLKFQQEACMMTQLQVDDGKQEIV